MRKKFIVFVYTFSCIIALSGCGNQVELTNQESELIAEYAAGILLKYDKNYDSGLSYMQNQNNVEVSGEMELSQEDETEQIVETVVLEESNSEADTENVTEISSVNSENLNEVLESLPFTITYIGSEFAEYYPNKGIRENMDYVVNPKEGNQLLVLKFDVKNTSTELQKINLLVANPEFNITINNNDTLKAIKTVLLNDLSTVSENIGAGETLETVLLCEVPVDYKEEISSISLEVSLNDISTYVILK